MDFMRLRFHSLWRVEPTESESKEELDRFITAMKSIREEIRAIAEGKMSTEDNPLIMAPHTADEVVRDWQHAYSRELAAFPAAYVSEQKYWPPVARIDSAYGDRNLICTCPSVESYAMDESERLISH
jgi:glycine dehydrogenase